MPFCSQCGVEYVESAVICSDCGLNLYPDNLNEDNSVSCIECGSANNSDGKYCYSCGSILQEVNLNRLPMTFRGDTIQCDNCDSNIPVLEFCVECGYLLKGDLSCHNHANNPAKQACLICKRPLCGKCGQNVNGKFICFEDQRYQVEGQWAKILTDDDEKAVNLARETLESLNIYTIIGSKSAGSGGWSLGLFSENMYTVNEGSFQLFVPIIQLKDAEKILLKKGLLFENVCDNCGHEFNGDAARCPDCGEEFIDG